MTCAGAYGVIDSLWFDLGGRRVDATVVSQKPSDEGGSISTLQLTVGGRVFQDAARGAYGYRWINDCPPIEGRVPVLYLPARGSTRLAAFLPLYAIPLMVLWFGGVFTLARLAGFASNYSPWQRRVLITAFWVVFGCGGAAPLAIWLFALW